ncbi:bifunctional methylenetetrahydrofolate dehydrogenase/methenyltetrahydrofolate cyclohydrolase FolD [Parvularcula sp. IMCC14364]|uniref:bifunctional methylenetetrahydrofolate dehydrogenase/methenyltetrahydrofolate cyclohydrolase FolD n=1 Tax=Parvularcula sp. IMCC14364 TaxID=3067902 RepID=UPI0027410EB1|nr:bifunctional methylenetetrahydrofolate dehydrogenase/methenyltetrahydrofolate cyclohydrolase FolD [Parvularcula sp. IMCC14364]
MPDSRIINGKEIAAKLVDAISAATGKLTDATGITPGLSVVLVGEDPASQVYVRNKGKMADKCGFKSEQHTLDKDTSEADLLSLIEDLNADPTVHGILVQLPLPDHIDETKVLRLIDPAKDVDGFHPVNVGLLHSGQTDQALVPCTPAGSILLAKAALGKDLSGLNAVIVGRSNIVGKPVAQLLLQENCTVTIAHSRTRNIADVVCAADIVVAAVGRAEMVKADWIKPGATVIDVGINRVDAPEKGPGKTRLVGDVAYTEVSQTAGAITPVPGGVGPMTIAMLMANTYVAAGRLHDVGTEHVLDLSALHQDT